MGCTPCRQRRGKVLLGSAKDFATIGCTPCRQRRGKGIHLPHAGRKEEDAPRAGSAEAKTGSILCVYRRRDAPRAGSAEAKGHARSSSSVMGGMHPVQAAPRQSYDEGGKNFYATMHPVQAAPRQRVSPNTLQNLVRMHPVQAAPRQRIPAPGSIISCEDAPRAGSAEAKTTPEIRAKFSP